MARRRAKIEESPGDFDPGFTVLRDTREQEPFRFNDIYFNGDSDKYNFDNIFVGPPSRRRKVRVRVEEMARGRGWGDYGVLDFPGIAIERKSKADLFATVADDFSTGKFTRKLALMAHHRDFPCVVVEADRSSCLYDPPPFASVLPLSVMRRVDSWTIQFPPVHWYFCGNRADAEETTFWLMSKYVEIKKDDKSPRNTLERRFALYDEGFRAKLAGHPFTAWPEESDPGCDWARGYEAAERHARETGRC